LADNDILNGDLGNDAIDGGTGADTINGGDGTDALFGNDDEDNLVGGEGADTLDGGSQNDTLDGGAGNDTILGQGGNDVILAGDGVDLITGGAGADTMTGGAGNDTFRFATADASTFNGTGADLIDSIEDFVTGDVLAFNTSLSTGYITTLVSDGVHASYALAYAAAASALISGGSEIYLSQVGSNVYVFVDLDAGVSNVVETVVLLKGTTVAAIQAAGVLTDY
jgi:Ca2+-binding RTX toxin-like protein